MSGWTQERYEILTKLWKEGQSGSQIGSVLGITRNAVMGKVAALGLQRGKNKIQRSPKPPGPPGPRNEPAPSPVARKPIQKSILPVLIPTEKVDLATEEACDTWVEFGELKETHCKWIVSPSHVRPHMFCGAPRVHEKPYCGRHCDMSYVDLKPRNRGGYSRLYNR
jgi:GcrA cell cycle regulator